MLSFEKFVTARHGLWLERSYQIPAPEYADVLRGHRYTNLWRELDRGTRHLFNNVQRPLWDNPAELIRHTYVYRVFNFRHTYEAIISFGINRPADELFEFLCSRGPNFNSSAYMRCNGLRPTCDAISNLAQLTQEAGLSQGCVAGDSKAVRRGISKLFSMGPFCGDQLMMDLAWRGGPFPLSFTPKFGPGAKRGFQYCQEDGPITKHDLIKIASEAILPNYRPVINGQPLEYGERELEHTLCELAKHVKVERANGKYVKMRKYNRGAETRNTTPFSWDPPLAIKHHETAII